MLLKYNVSVLLGCVASDGGCLFRKSLRPTWRGVIQYAPSLGSCISCVEDKRLDDILSPRSHNSRLVISRK